MWEEEPDTNPEEEETREASAMLMAGSVLIAIVTVMHPTSFAWLLRIKEWLAQAGTWMLSWLQKG